MLSAPRYSGYSFFFSTSVHSCFCLCFPFYLCRDTSINHAQSLVIANDLAKEQLAAVQAELVRTKSRLEVRV